MNEEKIKLNFLRQETIPEIQFLVKEKKSQNVKSETNKFKLAIIIIGLVLTIIISSAFIFYQSQNYHLGEWIEELGEREKEAGITKSLFTITDKQITNVLESNINGITAITKSKYTIELIEKRTANIYYKINKLETNDIQVNIPLSFCNNDTNQCKNLENKFKEDYTKSIDEQSNRIKDKILRLSPNGKKLRFIITGESERVLIKN